MTGPPVGEVGREARPSAVLFDAGNTLVFLDPRRMVAIYQAEGLSLDRARFVSAEETARAELTARVVQGHDGTEPHLWRDYFDRILALTGVPARHRDGVGQRVRDAHAERHLWSWSPEPVARALDRLRGMGLRLGVISNADGRMEGALRDAGVRETLEFVIDSGRVGVSKPDPAIFRLAADALGLPPTSCLYVGDLYPVDVIGARSAGMGAILVDPAEGSGPPDVLRVPSVAALPDALTASPAVPR